MKKGQGHSPQAAADGVLLKGTKSDIEASRVFKRLEKTRVRELRVVAGDDPKLPRHQVGFLADVFNYSGSDVAAAVIVLSDWPDAAPLRRFGK